MSQADNFNQYSFGVSRKVYILGRPEEASDLSHKLSALNLVAISNCQNIFDEEQFHVIIAPCDFNDLAQVRVLARSLRRLNSPYAYKILFASRPHFLNVEHFLFSNNLGSSFLVFGQSRDLMLKEHLKKLIISREKYLPCESYQQEYARAKQLRDLGQMNRLSQKLSDVGKDNVQALRLQVQISHFLGQTKKALYYLKQLLAINSQDLWALNNLAKIYLKADKAEQGLQMINEHSDFGRYDIVHPQQGLVDCLSLLPEKQLSAPMYSFLNSRAALAVRAGHVKEGLLHYQLAVQGCPLDAVEEAKILYNMGIALLKLKNYGEASAYLQRSLELGGEKFTKAARPLGVTQKLLHQHADWANNPSKTSSPMDSNDSSFLDAALAGIEFS